MSQQRRKYDADVREGAIRLVIESGRLASWVSHSWRRTAAAGLGQEDELARVKAENAQLKREMKQVTGERDVLKRCMVLWVK
uniref:Transposase n=1 Tax=Streptomyces sp. NBC_00008 TaxID=2903610 RepID=A0AAU2W2Q5_9ACTN